MKMRPDRTNPDPMPEIPDHPDDPVEHLIQASALTGLWAEERSFAASGDCPERAELLDLEQGRIRDAKHRERLARHLVTCPHCLERNLGILTREAESGSPSTIPI